MIAMERGRWINGMVLALATAGALGVNEASAGDGFLGLGRKGAAKPAPAGQQAPADKPAPKPLESTAPSEDPRFVLSALPVNPNDPIALINGEAITRQQLSDECVARRGEEVLETLIARKLIEQALRAKKLAVTAAEIDQEIDHVAMRMAGIGREAWLRTLSKERGISPIQYARDIIYPALALRKLAASRVQVTEKDVQMAFEAQYGDKVRCRLIMVDKQRTAMDIWEELKRNPGGFEKLAQERSMDTGSRSLGGLLAEPIARHAYPQTVSDQAFLQLVDGDPNDKDPNHKPKDGAISGPIQVAEATWVILKREGLIPAQEGVSLKDANVHKQMHDMIYEVKLKEEMSAFFVELMKASEIDNKLTGRIKLANEEEHPDHRVDRDVKLMSDANSGTPEKAKPRPGGAAPAGKSLAAPIGAPADDALSRQAEQLRKSAVKP